MLDPNEYPKGFQFDTEEVNFPLKVTILGMGVKLWSASFLEMQIRGRRRRERSTSLLRCGWRGKGQFPSQSVQRKLTKFSSTVFFNKMVVVDVVVIYHLVYFAASTINSQVYSRSKLFVGSPLCGSHVHDWPPACGCPGCSGQVPFCWNQGGSCNECSTCVVPNILKITFRNTRLQAQEQVSLGCHGDGWPSDHGESHRKERRNYLRWHRDSRGHCYSQKHPCRTGEV